MREEILKLKLKPYDILLYKGKGALSQIIQWGTRSPYNHVAVVVDPSLHLVIESNTGHQAGVRATDLRKIVGEVDVFRVKSNQVYDAPRVASFLVERLGAPYDFLGVAWLGLLKILGLLTFGKLKVFSKFQKEKDYFCSELCYAAFSHAGLDIVPQLGEADITAPADIAKSKVLERVSNIAQERLSI